MIFAVPNPNRWRGTNWGTLQLQGLTAALPGSPTQWRAAGGNQDTLLMFMGAPIMYKENRTGTFEKNEPFFLSFCIIKVDRKDMVYF